MLTHQFHVCHSEKLGPILYDEKRFEKIFNVEYLKQLEFADWEVEQLVKKSCERMAKKNKIGQNAKWLGILFTKFINNPAIPPITIQWIHEKIGYGVFTNAAIPPWQYIGEYTGIIRRRGIIFPNLNDYCFMYPPTGLFLKAITIDSLHKGNFTRFINHSDRPNLESISVFSQGIYHIVFRSIQPIAAGSELTYDYGDVYWKSRSQKIADSHEGFILS